MSGSRSLWFKREHSPLFLLRSSIDRARSTSLETLLAVLLLFAGKTCVTLPFELESLESLSKTWETILVHSPRKAARLRSYFSILTANGEKSWKSVIPVCIRSAVLCKNHDALHLIWNSLNWSWISKMNWHWIEIESNLNFIELTWIAVELLWVDIAFHWIDIELNELTLNSN